MADEEQIPEEEIWQPDPLPEEEPDYEEFELSAEDARAVKAHPEASEFGLPYIDGKLRARLDVADAVRDLIDRLPEYRKHRIAIGLEDVCALTSHPSLAGADLAYVDGVLLVPPEHVDQVELLMGRLGELRAAAAQPQFRQAIQAHIDGLAQSRNYNDGGSLAGYRGSSVPAWAAEAEVFCTWRDNVWVYAYAEMDKVRAGTREIPTIDAFIAELPAIVWPEPA
ncbi:hypothetical protein [Mesorhizobium sp. 2RAF21]|uniref:hypothetical protein n=1 Tax=Mesorhizobium sp. 2RAF21 TaxID=3232995 RepID=UPI003F9793B7